MKKITVVRLLSVALTLAAWNANAGGFFDLLDAVTTGSKNSTTAVHTPADEDKPKIFLGLVDKTVVEPFYSVNQEGVGIVNPEVTSANIELHSLDDVHIVFKKLMFHTGDENEMYNKMMFNYDSDANSDAFAQTYITSAKKRGNIVRLYNPKLTAWVNQMVVQVTHFNVVNDGWRMYDQAENVLVESKPNGELVSILTRSHQSHVTVGVTSYMYPQIIFGKPVLRRFENTMTHKSLENLYIRDL